MSNLDQLLVFVEVSNKDNREFCLSLVRMIHKNLEKLRNNGINTKVFVLKNKDQMVEWAKQGITMFPTIKFNREKIVNRSKIMDALSELIIPQDYNHHHQQQQQSSDKRHKSSSSSSSRKKAKELDVKAEMLAEIQRKNETGFSDDEDDMQTGENNVDLAAKVQEAMQKRQLGTTNADESAPPSAPPVRGHALAQKQQQREPARDVVPELGNDVPEDADDKLWRAKFADMM